MSRLEGLQTCPRCEKQALPQIDPNSVVMAVECQNCGAIIERDELLERKP